MVTGRAAVGAFDVDSLVTVAIGPDGGDFLVPGLLPGLPVLLALSLLPPLSPPVLLVPELLLVPAPALLPAPSLPFLLVPSLSLMPAPALLPALLLLLLLVPELSPLLALALPALSPVGELEAEPVLASDDSSGPATWASCAPVFA